ncbi:MAG TPA: hypothetical protein VGI45_22475 [Terracidiphilus sp.]|jgi:hypothetical protein
MFVGLVAVGLVAFRSDHEPVDADAVAAAPIVPALELKPAPSTPIAEQKALLGDQETWRPEWDATIEKALPSELLSPQMGHDVRQFCPRFSAMRDPDKRAFWAYFFQALAGAEAGLKATSDVQHTEPQVAVVDGVSHRMVRAEGLLQLTYEDADRYGCEFDWKADKGLPQHDPDKTILQPSNNLLCGVNILESQLVRHKKPLLSTSSYWSTLRPGWPGNRVFLEQMVNVPEACGHRPAPELKESKPAPVAASR